MLIGTVCTLLSAAGLGVAFLVARRRRYALALRTAAVALLPVGLAMTGVVRFVVNMTFNPVAWAGFGVLACAVLLFLSGRLADGRGRGAAAGSAPEVRAVPGGATPSLPGSRGAGGKAKGAAADPDDFSDIEAILKKHGI
ncbi:hypothetical protein [Streptomyces radicis]|uniref:Cellulose synthase n=1 Tax=Streptomyces radicis TaxID=1750517 RepID=A0A3A9WY03_9ACTN|nr:hypothetical protein [Streptomyces radicis]RKN12686.1 hypothetical protein D7319_01685 [Streptomyces radicis]RKN27550.1 hypothetical protein D7318_01210 [Streptomyces radicis]